MTPIADFMQYVLPYVSGCSYPLAELHIRDVCIDFCKVAPVVQFTLDPIDALASQHEYDIESPAGMQPVFILDAWFQGRRMATYKTGDRQSQQTQFNTQFPGANPLIGTPGALQQTRDSTFILDYAPPVDIPSAITLLASMRPTSKATSVDDKLFSDFGYAIGLGAAARIMRIPAKEFSNIALSVDCERQYIIARTEARIIAESSFTKTSIQARPRRFI